MDFQFGQLCRAIDNYNAMMTVNTDEDLPLPHLPHEAAQTNVPQVIQDIFNQIDWDTQNALNFLRVNLQMMTTFTHQRYRDRLNSPDNEASRIVSQDAFGRLTHIHQLVSERFALFLGGQLEAAYDDYNNDDTILEFLCQRVTAIPAPAHNPEVNDNNDDDDAGVADEAPNEELQGSG